MAIAKVSGGEGPHLLVHFNTVPNHPWGRLLPGRVTPRPKVPTPQPCLGPLADPYPQTAITSRQ